MVNRKRRATNLDAVFAALAHPTRRAILEQLSGGDATVGELARPRRISPPAISRHLRVLERAGLLTVTPEWRVRRCQVDALPLGAAFGWLTRYRVLWEDRFDHLDRELGKMKQQEKEHARKR